MPSLVRNLFVGAISLWFGSLASIPKGYALCNGENGTPNLEERFVRGAGPGSPVGDIGGSEIHTHTFTGDGHDHDIAATTGVQGAATIDNFLSTDPATGTTDNETSLPLYYDLAYIMEL